jgi:hypothetical protein
MKNKEIDWAKRAHKETKRLIYKEIDCRFECECLQGDRGGIIKKIDRHIFNICRGIYLRFEGHHTK